MLLFVGIGSQMALVQDASAAAIAVVLDQVGARFKRIRTQRRMTLAGVAAATGISKSTMSRLETGQRRHLRHVLAVYAAHYNTRRPYRALRLRPPRPPSPVPEPVHGRIRRRPILGGLVNEYETAA